MGTFSAFKRAKLLGLKSESGLDGVEAVNRYLHNVAAKDDRRLKWIVERAARSCAEEMEEIERDLVMLDHFDRAQEAEEQRERLRDLEEDFRLLHGLEEILMAKVADNFARDMVAYFRRKPGP
jgi:hypothetical protein